MPRKPKVYDLDLLVLAARESTRIRQALIVMGLAPKGGNYRTIKRAFDRFGIDTSHFTGQSQIQSSKGISVRPITDYLTNKASIGSYELKQKLLKQGIKKAICEECEGTEWRGKPMPLELDHIDGNSSNNSLENLRILCANCHALTPTYRGKNKGKRSVPVTGVEPACLGQRV